MLKVGIRVRELSGFDDSLAGTALMHRAFAKDGGPLADDNADGGEKVGIANFLAGAIAVFKTPQATSALLGLASMSVDLGSWWLTQARLQTAAAAAALAGAPRPAWRRGPSES